MSSSVCCIMTCVYRRFRFLDNSELVWKNDSQLGSFKLEELTKLNSWVFDLVSQFWWFSKVRICIWIFLEGFGTHWRKLEIWRFGISISLTESWLRCYRVRIIVLGVGIGSICHLELVCKIWVHSGLVRLESDAWFEVWSLWNYEINLDQRFMILIVLCVIWSLE